MDNNIQRKNRCAGKQINVRLTTSEETKLLFVMANLLYQNVTDSIRDMIRNVYLGSQYTTPEKLKEVVSALPIDKKTKSTQINMRLNYNETQMANTLMVKFEGESLSDVIRNLIGIYYNSVNKTKAEGFVF